MTNSNSSSNFSQRLFLRVAAIGELWLFYGRLATITDVNELGHPTTLEVEDAGGRVRSFQVDGGSEIEPLATHDGTVLDAMRRATAPIEEARRAAELWFAAPRVGDVFASPGGVTFAIVELSSNGPITVCRSSYRGPDFGVIVRWVTYANVASLRDAYQMHTSPGYWVRAHSTLRPEFQAEFAPDPQAI
jgi:hypothetical protein